MTSPAAGRPLEAPGGRHRADGPRPGRLLPLLVGVLVVAVVGLAALAASLVGPGTPTTAAPSVTAAPTGSVGPSPGPAPGSSPASSAPADPAPVVPSAPVEAGAVLPGDPIPGPGAPLQPVDDVAPVALRVPSIAVDVPLGRLGLQPDGAIEVPADAGDAGWLTASAVPGRTGPAVVAGHVDSATGVAVFTRLGELAAGDPVEVDLSDGTTVRYVVTDSERYPKDAFPSAEVYGPAPASVLRLITCGGAYDRAAGSYEDNVVVYAVPAT